MFSLVIVIRYRIGEQIGDSVTPYKDIPKTLEELFDFDTNIYRYYNSILTYNKYKIEQGWKKNFISMDIEYQLKFLDNEYTIKKIIVPIK